MNTINIQPIEKRRLFDDGISLEVHSIFYTIQGEGPYCGHPAVFVRLAGCNLQCPSCDTEYTQGRKDLTVDEIYSAVISAPYVKPLDILPTRNQSLVVITGGEPFRQNITPLVDFLLESGFIVQIETNGTLPPSEGFCDHSHLAVVCSPKTGKVNFALQDFIVAYKYVLNHDSIDEDGLPIRALNHTASPRVARPHPGFTGPVYLQPMDPKDEEVYQKNVRAVKFSCMQHGYILQLQVHKLIGVE